MHTLMILLVGALSVQGVPYQALVEDQWENFKLQHGKFYQSEQEEQNRQLVFMENLHKVTEHNILYERGLSTYKMGINHLSDLPEEEFLQFYTMQNYYKILNSSSTADGNIFGDLPQDVDDFLIYDTSAYVDLDGLPEAVDWSKKGAVTPIKNQGICGSCWSFSATGSLEAQWFKKTGKLVSLSEQNLIDCSTRYHNNGCNGGWVPGALQYIKDNGGIDTEQSYPYQRHNGFCHYKPENKGAMVSGMVRFRGESKIKANVASVGPISVAIEVGESFRHYTSGVYYDPFCGHKLNHAVLVVGYGKEGGHDYWLVKNSWGSDWGDRGYIKMLMNRDVCGIGDDAVFPTV